VTGPDDELPPELEPLPEDAQAASRTAAVQAPTVLLIVGCFTVILLYPVRAVLRVPG
jgi:hypothetical protein